VNRLSPLLATILMASVAFAAAPEPAKAEKTTKASVVVTKLDVAGRHLTVKNDQGKEFTVDVDPAVRNLAQVKVGDKIVVSYYESLAASVRKAGDTTEMANQANVTRAKEGERPGGSATTTSTVPVTVVSVDTKENVVQFYGADKLVRTTHVVRPEGIAFIQKLKAGDQVVLTYTESLAISVEPAK
jgi:hypothetical protein